MDRGSFLYLLNQAAVIAPERLAYLPARGTNNLEDNDHMIKRLGILAATLALFAAPAMAASTNPQTATLNISASVTANCTAFTPDTGSISFDNYDVFTYPSGTPDKDTTAATFSTNCTQNAPIHFQVGIGSNCGDGSVSADRAMTDGSSHYLSYELYQDSGFATKWPFTCSGGASNVNQTAGGAATANSISIYGLIPGGQDAFEGSYTDTVQVSVSY